jgi:hypothetical protein
MVVLFAIMVLIPTAGAAGETHPRLLLTPERIATIKAEIAKPGTHHQEVFAAIKARVDGRHWYEGAAASDNLKACSRMAIEAACVYAITGDAAYAKTAYEAIINENDGRATSLHKGSGSLAFAFAYDWAWPGWSEAERAAARTKLGPLFDYIRTISKGPADYNKTAVYRGSQICLTYALGEEDGRAEELAQAVDILQRHLQDGYGDLGVFPEGNGYAGYSQAFIQPAAAVLRGRGRGEIIDAVLAKHRLWNWMMYAGEFIQEGPRGYLQCGVGGKGEYNEGWASAMLANVPAEALPYYLWWYDRHMGRFSPGPAAAKFDNDKGASPYALACYPVGVEAVDPTGVLPKAVQDTRIGFGFFRNRWRNADDILISLAGDREHSDRGWDQNEATQLLIASHGTRWFLGPGKERGAAMFSCLLVDGNCPGTIKSKTDGTWDHFAATGQGGYAIAGGGEAYAQLGTKVARHLIVDFAPPDENTAVLGCLDRIDGKGKVYTWQAQLDQAVVATVDEVGGRPRVLLTGVNGTCAIQVLHPASAKASAKDRLVRIEAPGPQTELWLALVLAPKEATLPVTCVGEGLATVATIGHRRLAFDAQAGRMTITVP